MPRRFIILLKYILSVLGVIVVTYVKLRFPVLGAKSPFMLYFFTVTASSYYGGFGPGLLTAILSGLIVNYEFLPPAGFSFAIPGLIKTVGYILEGFLVVHLMEVRRQAIKKLAEHNLQLQLSRDQIIDTLLGRETRD